MKLQRLLLLIIMVIFTQSVANAALELELTQGVDRALPLAIVSFSGQQSADAKQQVSAIVSADLQNSGRFRLVKGNAKNQPNSPQAVDYSFWRKQGADNIVVGKVQALSGGRSQVTFQLLDVLSNNHVLVNKTFTVNNRDLRALAHHISDMVYQQLTGDRGIFSTRIAYVLVQRSTGKKAKYMLEVADADGFNPQALLTSSQPIMSPSWSPDGKQIAYVSFEKKRAQIYIVNVATGQRRLVSSFPGINGAPAWSPRGKYLAVVLSRSGAPKINLINLATGAVSQLTKGSAIDTEPSFSPDGNNIIFTSNRGGSPQIYKVNIPSGRVQRVTFNGNYNARASFTPNGQDIIMLHRNGGLFNIAIQDIKSGQLIDLTRSGQDESPSVAPNGKMVIYATHYGGNGVLSVVSTDGRVQLRLPARDGDVQEPAWSPFLS